MHFAKTGVIDAHHHLWKLDALDYGWLKRIGEPKPFGDPTPIQRDYLIEQLKTDAAAVNLTGSVHVQCDPSLPDPVAETAFVQAIADEAGFPNAIVGFANLTDPGAPEIIERHAAHRNFRGVRHIVSNLGSDSPLNFAPPGLLSDSKFQQNLRHLAERGLIFELQFYPNQADEALAALPDGLTVVIDHFGSPHDLGGRGIARWRDALAKLAARPNSFIKLSGLGMYDADWYAGKPLSDLLWLTLLELFGADRIVLGSNFPVDSLMRRYRAIFADFEAWLAPLSADEQQAIAAGNARRLYDF